MKGLGDEDFIRGYIVINWLKIISCYQPLIKWLVRI